MNERYPAEDKQYENDYYGKGWILAFHIQLTIFFTLIDTLILSNNSWINFNILKILTDKSDITIWRHSVVKKLEDGSPKKILLLLASGFRLPRPTEQLVRILFNNPKSVVRAGGYWLFISVCCMTTSDFMFSSIYKLHWKVLNLLICVKRLYFKN